MMKTDENQENCEKMKVMEADEPLIASFETCRSLESGTQSFTAIKVASNSSEAITLLGLS